MVFSGHYSHINFPLMNDIQTNTYFCLHWILSSSVADPWHFSVDLDPDADPCLLLMDPDQDPSIFIINLQDPTKKIINYYFLKVHLHHFFKIKSQQEVTKMYELRFFLLFLLDDRRIRIQEAQKHIDPTDPDLDICYLHIISYI
jgi:hypothetical protein